jgi:hypothetical protein
MVGPGSGSISGRCGSRSGKMMRIRTLRPQLHLKIQRHGIRRLIYLYIFQHGHLRFVAVGHGDPLGDVQHDGNGVVRQHAHR